MSKNTSMGKGRFFVTSDGVLPSGISYKVPEKESKLVYIYDCNSSGPE